MSKRMSTVSVIVLPVLVIGTLIVAARSGADSVSPPSVHGKQSPVVRSPGAATGCRELPTPDPGLTETDDRLLIGPIEGLTTAWHPAPQQTAIPIGEVAKFYQPAPPNAEVTWFNAVEVLRDASGSFAECPLNTVGQQIVRSQVFMPFLGQSTEHVCLLNVLDTAASAVSVFDISVMIPEFNVDENSSNEVTMAYFFGCSIAALKSIGPDRYRTSVGREIIFTAKVTPPAFAPLVEWRVGGQPEMLGNPTTHVFQNAGTYEMAAGPPEADEPIITLETYRVAITNYTNNVDVIPEGVPLTFEANTEPPGLESEITWLSSTKYGTGTPIIGHGPTFTVQFDETFGPWSDGGSWQWLGVRADNATFGQDQKMGCCIVPNSETCFGSILQTSCAQMGGMFTFQEFDCEDGLEDIGDSGYGICGICIRTPIGPGQVKFIGCTPGRLADFGMMPENTPGTITTPANNVWYGVEGFWWRFHVPNTEWFKIPDHCSTVITCTGDGGFTWTSCCNCCASVFYGRSRWSSDAAITPNPF